MTQLALVPPTGRPVAETAPEQKVSAAAANRMQDPRYLCAAVGKAVVEVLSGVRPIGQLMRWLSLDIYDALDRRKQYAQVSTTPPGRLGARVLGIRIQQVSPIAFEANLTVDDRQRVRALAMRLERKNTGWRVVNLEIA